MEQGWYNLLFAHWRVPAAQVRALVPRELELDTFEGDTWVSLTPLFIRMRPRGAFAVGRVWSFPELNCRTYVTHQSKPGIYFFSLDARSLPAVVGARALYRLPYFHARMGISHQEEAFRFVSERRSAAAVLEAVYEPVAEARFPEPGTLEHWLSERYCLYTVAPGRVWRAEIHHARWPLQEVRAEIVRNTVTVAAGLGVQGPPELMHYSAEQEVLVWPLRRSE